MISIHIGISIGWKFSFVLGIRNIGKSGIGSRVTDTFK